MHSGSLGAVLQGGWQKSKGGGAGNWRVPPPGAPSPHFPYQETSLLGQESQGPPSPGGPAPSRTGAKERGAIKSQRSSASKAHTSRRRNAYGTGAQGTSSREECAAEEWSYLNCMWRHILKELRAGRRSSGAHGRRAPVAALRDSGGPSRSGEQGRQDGGGRAGEGRRPELQVERGWSHKVRTWRYDMSRRAKGDLRR